MDFPRYNARRLASLTDEGQKAASFAYLKEVIPELESAVADSKNNNTPLDEDVRIALNDIDSWVRTAMNKTIERPSGGRNIDLTTDMIDAINIQITESVISQVKTLIEAAEANGEVKPFSDDMKRPISAGSLWVSPEGKRFIVD